MLLKLMVLPLLLMPPTLSCTVSFVANAAETNGGNGALDIMLCFFWGLTEYGTSAVNCFFGAISAQFYN